MDYIKVKLWGNEIGRLVWEPRKRRTYFLFNSDQKESVPDIAPLLAPKSKTNAMFPIYGDDRPIYQRLPPFIADSLPDSWGNILFDKWVTDNKISRNKITPLYKLMFIGTRGMGALEYEPADESMNHVQKIDLHALYDLSLQVLEQRDSARLRTDQEITMQALLSVGTSAGGRQMKAIIVINDETGEIRSGQVFDLKGYDYYILKFADPNIPLAEIEMAYYAMAKDAGINMEDSRLMRVEENNHFLTKRFDRKNGKKVFSQTLAAIYPEAGSYEDMFAVCRELSLKESEVSQLFRRMAFNVLSNNTDDHIKNFSFIMEEDGIWHLSPAYDITFIFNDYGTGPSLDHCLNILGKVSGITKSDMLEFARGNEIRNAAKIIDEVAAVVGNYAKYAELYGITKPWTDIINKTIHDNLEAYGYVESKQNDDSPIEIEGHSIGSFAISINTKGFYDVDAVINGNRRRRVVRTNQPEFEELRGYDIFNLNSIQKAQILKLVFNL